MQHHPETAPDRAAVLQGYLFIVAAAVLWGVLGPFSRYAFSHGIAPLEVAFWRATLAWGLFAVHAVVIRETRVERRDIGHLIVFGVLGVAVFFGSYQIAVERGGAALASVLLYTGPAWVTVMARLLFREKLGPIKLLALGMTLFGVVAAAFGGGNNGMGVEKLSFLAIGAGLASGFCYSLYYIYGKHFSGRYSSPNLFLYLLPVGALALYPLVDFSHKTIDVWVVLIVLAFFSTYGAYFFYYLGLRRLEASRASIVATLEPVVAAVVAFFWWNERFGILGYLGSIFIITAVILVVWDGAKKRPA